MVVPVPAKFAAGPVAATAVAPAAALLALSSRYGYHRDELYFRVAGQHLAWGYVDQPPLTPVLARASIALFGDTPTGLRVVAAIAYAFTVVVVALLAREFGAGRRAQFLAAVTTAVSSMVLASGHLVSTPTFDILFWLLLCLFVARLLRTGEPRWYLAIGAVTGVALLNKYLVVLAVAGLAAGLLLAGPRAALRTWWLPAGMVLALLIAAPNLWWQMTHGWPQLTVAAGIDRKQGLENRISFVPFQLIYLAPPLVPIWVAGWLRLWRTPKLRTFAIAYPLVAVVVLALGGKAYYVIPLVIVLLAAGAEPAVQWAARGRRGWVLPTIVVFSAAVNAIVVLPVLPPNALGFVNSVNKEQGEQVGWPQLVRQVAVAWQRLPDRDRAVIYAQNYGEAGAIARYGPDYGLPAAYSGHMSFADWGPPPDSANGPVLLIHLAGTLDVPANFAGCRRLGRVDNGVGLKNDEHDGVLEQCSGVRGTWSARWPALRTYY
ncbi:ArnT family glycosyltransferase [Amycolatopsis benzoatilytica]|uniref:ArnT family glycosyltransferase n=1 Tax=Amycolatopsis benzoatilytica TaxID=346045 RepID=UPI000382A0E9|nr:glycosyltransferase family 39 protein [Amycolatopsis benzoatilytica]